MLLWMTKYVSSTSSWCSPNVTNILKELFHIFGNILIYFLVKMIDTTPMSVQQIWSYNQQTVSLVYYIYPLICHLFHLYLNQSVKITCCSFIGSIVLDYFWLGAVSLHQMPGNLSVAPGSYRALPRNSQEHNYREKNPCKTFLFPVPLTCLILVVRRKSEWIEVFAKITTFSLFCTGAYTPGKPRPWVHGKQRDVVRPIQKLHRRCSRSMTNSRD